MSDPHDPLHLFRFHVQFRREKDNDAKLAFGAFSECTGLEATMEPRSRPSIQPIPNTNFVSVCSGAALSCS